MTVPLCRADIARIRESGCIADLGDSLSQVKDQVTAAVMTLSMWAMQKRIDESTLRAYDIMTAFGDLVMAQMLGQQAVIAHGHLLDLLKANGINHDDKDAAKAFRQSNADAKFFHGKVNAFRFYVKNLLPRAGALVQAIQSEDKSALEPIG